MEREPCSLEVLPQTLNGRTRFQSFFVACKAARLIHTKPNAVIILKPWVKCSQVLDPTLSDLEQVSSPICKVILQALLHGIAERTAKKLKLPAGVAQWLSFNP